MSQEVKNPIQRASETGNASAVAGPVAAPARTASSNPSGEAIHPPKFGEVCGGVSICCLCMGIILIIILIPLSFVTLEYYEYGFVQRRSTGAVKLNKVYYGGRHFLGPDIKFRRFPADAQLVQLENINAISSDKLVTFLDVSFVYYIKREELPSLKKDFDITYDQVVQSTALAAIKNTGVQFSTSDYFTNRTLIESSLLNGVMVATKPLHITVAFLRLARVAIPDQVYQKQLAAAIQLQNNDAALYQTQAQLIRAQTQSLVNGIQNQAQLVVQTQMARAAQNVSQATATADLTVQSARNSGLSILYSTLKITDAKLKASLDYINSITKADANLHLGYQTKFLTVGA